MTAPRLDVSETDAAVIEQSWHEPEMFVELYDRHVGADPPVCQSCGRLGRWPMTWWRRRSCPSAFRVRLERYDLRAGRMPGHGCTGSPRT